MAEDFFEEYFRTGGAQSAAAPAATGTNPFEEYFRTGGAQSAAARAAATPEPEEEEDKKPLYQDLGQGVAAGIIDIFQGIGESVASIVDVQRDTDFAPQVTEGFTELKEFLNATPTGAAGKSVESIVNFAGLFIPAARFTNLVSKAARGIKILGSSRSIRLARALGGTPVGKAIGGTRGRLMISTSMAAGASDFISSPEGVATMADIFGVLPEALETEEYDGQTGAEEGARRLRNKARFAVEGSTASMAFDVAIPVIGAVARLPAKLPGVPYVARKLSNFFDAAGQKITGIQTWGLGDRIRRNFTSAGGIDRAIHEDLRATAGVVDRYASDAVALYNKADDVLRDVVKKQRLGGRGTQGIKTAAEDMKNYLDGWEDISGNTGYFRRKYGNAAADAVEKLREPITDLTLKLEDQIVANSPGLRGQARTQLLANLHHGRNKYISRMYDESLRPAMDPNLTRDPKFISAVNQVESIMQNHNWQVPQGSTLRVEAEEFAKRMLNDDYVIRGLDLKASMNLIEDGKRIKGQLAEGRKAVFRMNEGPLKPRNQILDEAKELRKLMGEVTDPREAYIRTVGKLADLVSSNNLYAATATRKLSLAQAVAKMNASQGRGARPMVIDGLTVSPEEAFALRNKFQYRQLGEIFDPATQATNDLKSAKVFGGEWGAMQGNWVPAELYTALTQSARAQNVMTHLWSLSLQAKGISQATKTLMSPYGQVRNMLSGSIMLGNNGNWGFGMNLDDSIRLVMGSADNFSDAAYLKHWDLMHRTGTIGQNLQINEYKALLGELAEDINTPGGLQKAFITLGKKMDRNPVTKAGLKPFKYGYKKMADFYGGADDLWKTVGYFGEKGKIQSAFRKGGIDAARPGQLDAFAQDLMDAGLLARSGSVDKGVSLIDLMATDTVKATMPTYSNVPEFIKGLRKVPVFGNYIAYPAEILRTGFNILDRGLKELAFQPGPQMMNALGPARAKAIAAEIRAVGASRLTSFMTLTYGLGYGATKGAQMALEMSDEQLDALRSQQPYFMKGHTTIPLTWDGKGSAEYIDFSYMAPYDYLLAPMKAAIQAYEEKGAVTQSEISRIMAGAEGAFASLLEPFASESLLAERVADVTLRNGKTQTGAIIYGEGELPGDKRWKGLQHVIAGFSPAFLDPFVQERAGKWEPGRITNALMGRPDAYGRESTLAGEAFTAMTGMRLMKVDLKNNFSFKGGEYSSNRRDAYRLLAKEAYANNSTDESVIAAYEKANETLRYHQAQLFADVKAARLLGLENHEIRRQLIKKSNLSKKEVNAVLRGEFEPIRVSRPMLKKVMEETFRDGQPRVIARLPIGELNQRYFAMRFEPLVPPELPSTQPEHPLLATAPEPQAAPAPVAGAPQPQGLFPAGSAGAAPAPAPQQPAQQQQEPPNPALLGSNPMDILKNMTLVGR